MKSSKRNRGSALPPQAQGTNWDIKSFLMNGQWTGQFSTSSNGNGSLINIDERETFYQGVAYTHPDDLKLPRTAAFFRTKDKDPVTELRTDAMLPLDPETWNIAKWEAWASGIFQMAKVTEIVAGFMLLVGIFPALATLFLAPDVVGIVIVNARLMPSFLWLGVVVFVLTAYLGYVYWDRYKAIFSHN